MAAQPEPVAMAVQPELGFEVIKQHPGPVQVSRKVLVNVPGRHFSNPPGSRAAARVPGVPGTPIEYAERHRFERHARAWGAAHQGPGMRFICESDAMDDPDHKGVWIACSRAQTHQVKQ